MFVSRLTSFLTTALLVMQMVVISLVFWYLLNTRVLSPQEPLTILRLVNPQHVLNKTVREHDLLRVNGTKCNLTNEPISVEGVAYLVQESPVYVRYLRATNVGVVRVPGCQTVNYANDLRLGVPDNVTLEPGVYHLEGTETVRIGDRVQNAPWYTESFEIVK